VDKANRVTASAFLTALVKAVPYKVHTVLTDNSIVVLTATALCGMMHGSSPTAGQRGWKASSARSEVELRYPPL
jgi:hypothetical protein